MTDILKIRKRSKKLENRDKKYRSDIFFPFIPLTLPQPSLICFPSFLSFLSPHFRPLIPILLSLDPFSLPLSCTSILSSLPLSLSPPAALSPLIPLPTHPLASHPSSLSSLAPSFSLLPPSPIHLPKIPLPLILIPSSHSIVPLSSYPSLH